MKPAKYIKLKYGEDPLIYGMIDGDPHQYVESFQATPHLSAGPLRTYTSGQLEFFEDDHNLHPEVDSAVYHLYDKSALAEVECYRINKKKLKREYEELRQCYVLVERSARLELDGYDFVVWLVALEACASSTL